MVGTAVFVVVAMVFGGLAIVIDARPASAAVPAPATSDPTTSSHDVRFCPPNTICIGGGTPTILKSRIPVDPNDNAGVSALQGEAENLVAALHEWDPKDRRINQWGQSDVWGAMWGRLISVIKKPAGERTEHEKDQYHWFQQVVQQYRIKSAEAAQQEYRNWQSQGCAYKPAAPSPPTPAYNPGVGCGNTTPAGLFVGARPPKFEDLQAWGAYTAVQQLGQSSSTPAAIGNGLAAALSLAAVAVGSAVGIGLAASASAATAATLASSMAPISLLSTAAGTALGAGALVLAAVAVVVFVLAIVALVVAIVQQAQYGEIPGKLQGAIDTARNTPPNLEAMVDDTTATGGNVLFALFVGQTEIERPQYGNRPTNVPTWHGDTLKSQSFDTGVNPPAASGGLVSSKAVSVKTWGNQWDNVGAGASVTWLTDQGWFYQAPNGSSTWTTESSLRYIDWDNKQRTALIQGDHFLDLTSDGGVTGGSPANACNNAGKCQKTSTLRMRDANDTPIAVTLGASIPVQALINDNAGGTYKAGETTTFTNPSVDSQGNPVTYKWEFESRCGVGELCIAPFNPVTGQSDQAFHGNPVVTSTGQTVSYKWPTAGTFHVRHTTTNAAGSLVSEKDIVVGPGAAPTITIGKKSLGPLIGSGGTVTVNGCMTVASSKAKPTVTIDWGDGAVETAKIPSIVFIINDVVQPTGEPFLLQSGASSTGGCTGTHSFVAHHTYTTSSETGYSVSASVNDGDGQSASATVGTVRFVPAVLDGEFTAPSPSSYQGLPAFEEGQEITFNAFFNADPAVYGASVDIDWGQHGVHTAFFNQCHATSDGPVCTIGDSLTAKNTFWSKPGSGEWSIYTPTLTVRESDGDIKFQQVARVAIRNVAPVLSDLAITPSPTAQGQTVTLSGKVTSVDPYTPVAIKVVWPGADGRIDTINLPAGGGERTFQATHVYREVAANRMVTVHAYDDGAGVASDFKNIQVVNTPPSPSIPPVTGEQGSPVAFSIATGDPGLDTYSTVIDWGDGSAPQNQMYAPTASGVLTSPGHVYAVPGLYDVSVSLDDNNGGTATATGTVDIANVKPSVSLDVTPTGDRTVPLSLTGLVTDPGALDAFTGTVDWRDGSPPEAFSVPANARSFALPHNYAEGGVYPVSVHVSDDQGGTSDEAIGQISVNGPPVFNGTDPGKGVVGQPVGFQFAAAGFPLPSYAVTDGGLPPGLSLGTDGFLSGTPNATGTFTFEVTTTNTFGSDVTAPIAMEVGSTPAFTADDPPNAILGRSYSYPFVASGVPAPTFSVTGDLPAGLSLHPTTGVLSGTPTALGPSTFTVNAANFAGDADTPSRTIDVVPVPIISVGDASGPEGGPLVIPVSLSHASPEPVRVDFATEDGTARAGKDYIATSGRFTFNPGETSKDVAVTLLSDPLDEADETFSVRLNAPRIGTLGDRVGVGTVQDDDPLPTVSVADEALTEGAPGTRSSMTFPVQLSAPSGRTVTVAYATTASSATAGVDYRTATGTVKFAPGETSKSVRVSVLGDALDEVDETFDVQLSSPLNVDMADGTATGTIVDDDQAPKLTATSASVVEGGPGTTSVLSFRLRLSAPSGRPVNVAYATADGTAFAGQDYTGDAGTITFLPGETTKNLQVTVLGDGTVEPAEKFAVWLNSAEAVLRAASVVGTIKNDD